MIVTLICQLYNNIIYVCNFFFFFHCTKVFFPLRDIVLLLSFLIQNKLVLYFFYIYTVTSLSSVLTKTVNFVPFFSRSLLSRVSPVFVIIWNALNHKWLCLFKNLRRKQKIYSLFIRSVCQKHSIIYEF